MGHGEVWGNPLGGWGGVGDKSMLLPYPTLHVNDALFVRMCSVRICDRWLTQRRPKQVNKGSNVHKWSCLVEGALCASVTVEQEFPIGLYPKHFCLSYSESYCYYTDAI